MLSATGPTVSAVVNPASNIPPGLPNYGIAQGSIFVAYGSGLDPSTLIEASSLPLPTTAGLAGTTVSVTVNGSTLPAPMVYTSQFQIAAILPSATPVGTGTISVSYSGLTATSPLVVVASNFGISTINQTGTGGGVVTFPNSTLVTATNSAKPGDTLVIWGTGLGPISGSDATLPTPSDLGTPIQVYAGSSPVSVVYRGRSSSPGLDQINIIVPQGVSYGCGVSLAVQTGTIVSNVVSIPIAPSGGVCSDPGQGSTVTVPTLPAGATSYSYAIFEVGSISESTTSSGQLTTSSVTNAVAEFERLPVIPSTPTTTTTTGSTTLDTTVTSIGSCYVLESGPSTGTSTGTGSGGTSPKPTPLDAGKSITAAPPTGNPTSMPLQMPGNYAGTLTAIPGGVWQFSNGSGGADVGPFTFNQTFSPPLVWTNQSVAETTISRTQPLTITWTGGDPATPVQIELSTDLFDSNYNVTGSAVFCSAPDAPGQFTVPPYVLLSLIPNATVSTVSVSQLYGNSITIPGIDLAEFYFVYESIVGTATTIFK